MILIIDNYDSFTYNLVQRLGEIDPTLEPGRDLIVVRNDEITPDDAAGMGPSHLIISPGPCTPREAGQSSAILDRLAGRVPILGVCLGHQCMADRFGMTVAPHAVLMHGKTSPIEHDGRGVFEGLPSPFEATRYHSLVVRPETIPPPPARDEDGWVVSATTRDVDGSTVVQGLRRVWASPVWAGDPELPDGTPKAPLEGVQFHPESFMTIEGPRLLANFLRMGLRPRPVDDAAVARIIREAAAVLA